GESELAVSHGLAVFLEVSQLVLAGFCVSLIASGPGEVGVDGGEEIFNAAHIQQANPSGELGIGEAESLGDVMEMLASVVKINDVDGVWEVGGSDGFV